jgi:PAS domain S-box-containing protein
VAGGGAAAAATALGDDSSTLRAVQQIHAITQAEERALALQRDDLTREVKALAMASLSVLLVVAVLAIFALSEVARRGHALRSANRALAEEIDAVKSLEKARAASEQRFELLVKGLVDYALYMLDSNGRVTSWNTGAERIKGYKAEEILGENFARFYTPEDQARGAPKRALETALREGKFEAEAWRVRKDGSYFLASVVLDPLFDETGKHIGFAKITRDITERHRQQEMLEQTRATLAQAQKMEALGQLTGGIAHDFNNMLAIILGALNIMQRRLARGETHVTSLIESAIEGAQRGAALTQRLLAFARKQALAPTRVDPNRLVSGMSDMIRRTLGETVQTEVILGGGAWPVQVDVHQLETAIINLVVNARDAMAGAGRLTIETSNAHLDHDYARRHGDLQPGQYVAISISDTGIGMAPDILQKVFDPFFTTKRTGTGLGLSQVYGFIKQSGGHITIYSEVGKGTTVRLYMPRDTQPAVETRKEAEDIMPRARPGEAILVVEDEDAVRALSVEGLRELGYVVLQAESGERALEVLGGHPEIGLLFTDVVMPNMNGRQLAEEACRQKPTLKVLYTTGYAQNAIVHAGRLDPSVRLLSKPFMIGALARAVRDAFDDGETRT